MTVTEAGACGTPAVVSRISGHRTRSSTARPGLLFDDVDGMVAGARSVLSDDEVLRKRLGAGALDFASQFSWEATARQTLADLAAEAMRRVKA